MMQEHFYLKHEGSHKLCKDSTLQDLFVCISGPKVVKKGHEEWVKVEVPAPTLMPGEKPWTEGVNDKSKKYMKKGFQKELEKEVQKELQKAGIGGGRWHINVPLWKKLQSSIL